MCGICVVVLYPYEPVSDCFVTGKTRQTSSRRGMYMRLLYVLRVTVSSARLTSTSALLSLGLMEHGNGLGRLYKDNNDLGSSKQNSLTHLTRPPEYVKLNGEPSEPPRLSILQTESTVVATINIVVSTKCLPGQTRFPNPNTDVNVASSRGVPFGLRNRPGLKTSGSGYTSGSRVIALRTVGKYR